MVCCTVFFCFSLNISHLLLLYLFDFINDQSTESDDTPLKLVFKMTKVETGPDGPKEQWTVEGPPKRKRKEKKKKKRKHKKKNHSAEVSTPPITIKLPKKPVNSVEQPAPLLTTVTGKRKEIPQDSEQITEQPPTKRTRRPTTKLRESNSPTPSRSSPSKAKTSPKSQTKAISPVNGSSTTQKRRQSKSSRVRTSATPQKKKPMALYKVIANMIKQLIQCDQHSIFYDRVTDEIAPNYTSVIKHPMSFTQMRDKLQKRLYKDLESAQMDFKLIFVNAMEYNPPDSIYYSEAQRVMEEAKKLTENYKEKLDPSDWGASDPLFNDSKPYPIAIDLSDVPKSPPKRREVPVTPPAEKPSPVSTPKPRIRAPYRKRQPKATPTATTPIPIKSSSLLSLPSVPPPSTLPAIKVDPSHVVRRFVTISRGLVPYQGMTNTPSPDANTVVYNMYTERQPNTEIKKPTTGYEHISSNTLKPMKLNKDKRNPVILASSSSVENRSDNVVDQYVSQIPQDTATKLSKFFSVLEETPEDISTFQINESHISPQVLQSIGDIQPLESLNNEIVTKIKSLEKHGVSLDFLESPDVAMSDVESDYLPNIQSLLDTNANLITSLFSKQKSRLDHEPTEDERNLAYSLLQSIVTTCSKTPPLALTPQTSLSETRKLLQKQIAHTNVFN